MNSNYLYYYPLAGASSMTFKDIDSYFSEETKAVCLDYPGHGQRIREARAQSMEELIEDAYEHLKAERKDGAAYYLAGHCMGAIIAYELCRRIEEEQCIQPPKGIFVSGHGIPSVIVSEELWAMDDETLLAHLIRNGLADRSMADPRYRKMVKGLVIDPIKADSALYDNYVFQATGNEKISSKIHVLYGKEDDRFPEQVLDKWADFTHAGITLKAFEGGHYFLFADTKAYFQAMAEIIGEEN